MTARFEGKIAIVTGAAQGIGRVTALRLASEGATVVLADRVAEQCRSVQAEVQKQGGRATSVIADLETYAGCSQMVQETLEAFGRIDVSVHNVGGTIWVKPFWEYAEDEIVREISRTLWPTLWSCRAVIPVMLRQKSGSIVNIGSVSSHGIYRMPYSTAKGGIHAMTASLAMELADHGVRVNCVAPGPINVGPRTTPRNPNPLDEREKVWKKEVMEQTLGDTMLRRWGLPEEIAAAICFLAADEASYITGQTLFAAGGGFG